jgi:cyclophilin family peptidyl-prolyl cis-trans isomerase
MEQGYVKLQENMSTKEDDTRKFLMEFKARASQKGGLYIVPRDVNIVTMAQLGLTDATLRTELLSLSVEDYYQGPELDEDASKNGKEVWMFGKVINGCEVYLKLKNFDVGPHKRAKCLSIHPADFPIYYPFRK